MPYHVLDDHLVQMNHLPGERIKETVARLVETDPKEKVIRGTVRRGRGIYEGSLVKIWQCECSCPDKAGA